MGKKKVEESPEGDLITPLTKADIQILGTKINASTIYWVGSIAIGTAASAFTITKVPWPRRKDGDEPPPLFAPEDEDEEVTIGFRRGFGRRIRNGQ